MTDIAGYTYRSANYCPGCVVVRVLERKGLQGHGLSYVTEDALALLARFEGIDRMDERSFDSDDFPKVIFGDMIEDRDERCDRCGFVLADVESGPHVWETTAPELGYGEVV